MEINLAKTQKTVKKQTSIGKVIGNICLNLIAWGASISVLFPLVWMSYSAVKDNGEFMKDSLALPTELIFDNFSKAFEIGKLWLAMGNSALYSIINIVIVAIMGVITAYFFSRYSFKGKKVIRMTYMMGMLIPLYALLVPLFVQYRLLDLINNRFSLIITYYAMSISLAIFLAESFIEGIPTDIDEASVIDGCGMTQRIMYIIFPLCKPIVATISIMTLLATWNEFVFAVVLTPDINLRTVSIALRYFTSGRELDYTFLMAALLCTSLPIIIAYLMFSKEVIKGMTAGAVKG